MHLKSTLLASAFVLAGFSSQASAADSTTPFQSTASVASSCSLTTTSNLSFGAYDPVSLNAAQARPSQQAARLVIRCNRQSPQVAVTYDQGVSPSGDSTCAAPKRNMVSSSGQPLRYTLNLTPIEGADQFFCDPAKAKKFSFATLTEANQSLYGFIPPGQNASPGTFSDTVTVTVAF